MNKQKWTEKPITWGGYLKFCGVFTVISTIISAVYCIALFEPAWWIGFRKTVSKEPFLRGWAALTAALLFSFPPRLFSQKVVSYLE